MTKKTLSLFPVNLLLCLLPTVVFCADERSVPPPREPVSETAGAAGLLQMVDVRVEVEALQPDTRQGLRAGIIVINRNGDAIDILNPQRNTEMEIYTAEGKYVQAVQAIRVIHQSTGSPEIPTVLHLEPGQEHRFTVRVTEYVPPEPTNGAAAAASASTAGSETGQASTDSSAATSASAASLTFVPLPEGTYKVHVLVPLSQMPRTQGERSSRRTVRSEAVTVVYGSGVAAGSHDHR